MDFPYGKAPLAILILALLSGAGLWAVSLVEHAVEPPDLIVATFTKIHGEAYLPAIAQFEREHGVRIQFQVVDQRALNNRLQAAFQAGAEVPDVVELLDGSMGTFTKGPLEDVGFVDLTERVHTPGVLAGLADQSLYDALVRSRFTKWSSRGRIFALPHDVHPVTLAYRRDLVEQLGINVEELTTWDKFCQVGRNIVTRDLNGDGVYDRYMIDLPAGSAGMLRLLLLQNDGALFDAGGEVAFDSDAALEVITWYVRQIEGPTRIAFDCGSGQNLSRAMIEGLCLFYLAPDWRTKSFEQDVPSLAGKLALMPLPAWREGDRRTSTWGGTGLAITRQCAERGRFDLAWKLAMHLYYDPRELGERFAESNILPPLKAAWDQPQFDEPRPFYSHQPIGRLFASLADEAPQEWSNPYIRLAESKLNEAFQNALDYYRRRGGEGLEDYTRGQLRRTADHVRRVMSRNVFLTGGENAP